MSVFFHPVDAVAEYTLYCFAQSGNAYKSALTLELACADWEPRFADYFKAIHARRCIAQST
jgi:glutathione S-transferase